MNCKSFDPARIEAARTHAGECRKCAVRWSNELALTAGLRAVAADAPGAPAHLEEALLAAFARRATRQAAGRPTLRPRSGKWIAAGIAAAMILASGWYLRPPAPPAVVRLEPAPPDPPRMEPAIRTPKARRPRIVRAAVRKPPQPAEDATEFYAVPYADPITSVERAEMVRVRVDARMQADVILGQDGLARAVRFINSSR